MKKVFAVVLVSVFIFSFSQKKRYEILAGISFPSMTGGSHFASDSGRKFDTGFNLGFINAFPINAKSEVELGLFYQNNRLVINSFSTGTTEITNFDKNFIWIPLNYRYNFGQGFFCKGGIVVLADIGKDYGNLYNYGGIGLDAAVGKTFWFSDNLGLGVQPYANPNSLIKFTDNPYRMMDFGIQLGLSFK